MKQLYIYIYLILFIPILTQCVVVKKELAGIQRFAPLHETVFLENLDELVEKYEIIELEETPESTIDEFYKLIIDKKGNMYVLSGQENILVFKPNGYFKEKISAQGKSSNEYTVANDIALSDDEKEIMILDLNRVICFDKDNTDNFREIKFNLNARYDGIAPTSNGGVYIFNGESAMTEEELNEKDSLIVKLDRDGNIVKKYLSPDDFTIGFSNVTYTNDKYLLRPQNSQNIVYEFREDEPVPLYEIYFHNQNCPRRYFYDNNNDFMGYMNCEYFKQIMSVFTTDKIVTYRAICADRNIHCFMHSKKDGKGFRWEETPDEFSTSIIYADSEYIYVSANKITFEKYYDNPEGYKSPIFRYVADKLKTYTMKNSENYNPLLIKLKLKI